jgi:hypothetical protein
MAQRSRCAAAAARALREPKRDSDWAVGTSVLLEGELFETGHGMHPPDCAISGNASLADCVATIADLEPATLPPMLRDFRCSYFRVLFGLCGDLSLDRRGESSQLFSHSNAANKARAKREAVCESSTRNVRP